ncbi:hypothetical protein Dacsa_2173 [Dactylococcopsis salina PCC 8305]|uniref:Uncharacterized protein n=1 Tax=Dactylococcopsis salina (strain PCC 8305) TaxID=13035 RepID=K9YV82_DACS8|nr:hypothetical protein Dacsa_2173 [Dactylococcopsis salina PCC 8305]
MGEQLVLQIDYLYHFQKVMLQYPMMKLSYGGQGKPYNVALVIRNGIRLLIH